MKILAYVVVLIIGVYLAMFYGCVQSYQPDDASLENQPSTEDIGQSFLAVRCIIPKPTVTGLLGSIIVAIAASYLGLRE